MDIMKTCIWNEYNVPGERYWLASFERLRTFKHTIPELYKNNKIFNFNHLKNSYRYLCLNIYTYSILCDWQNYFIVTFGNVRLVIMRNLRIKFHFILIKYLKFLMHIIILYHLSIQCLYYNIILIIVHTILKFNKNIIIKEINFIVCSRVIIFITNNFYLKLLWNFYILVYRISALMKFICVLIL